MPAPFGRQPRPGIRRQTPSSPPGILQGACGQMIEDKSHIPLAIGRSAGNPLNVAQLNGVGREIVDNHMSYMRIRHGLQDGVAMPEQFQLPPMDRLERHPLFAGNHNQIVGAGVHMGQIEQVSAFFGAWAFFIIPLPAARTGSGQERGRHPGQHARADGRCEKLPPGHPAVG